MPGNIIQCTLSCPNSSSTTSSTCTITSNTNISTDEWGVHPNSSIAVVNPTSNTCNNSRLFFQNYQGILYETQSVDCSEWQLLGHISTFGLNGTNLAAYWHDFSSVFRVAYLDTSKQLNVVYGVNNWQSRLLNAFDITARYTNTVSEDDVRLSVQSSPRTGHFTATWQPIDTGQSSTGGYDRIEYFNANNQLVEFYAVSGSWISGPIVLPISNPVSPDSPASLAMISWLNNVRVFYVSSGRMYQAVLTGTVPAWSITTID